MKQTEIQITKNKTTLAKHSAKIRAILGRDLPNDILKFYESCDGFKHQMCENGLAIREYDYSEVVTLEKMFDGFKQHNLMSESLKIDDSFEEIEGYLNGEGDAPFYETFFNEYMDVETKKDLKRVNKIMRQKLLSDCSGSSSAITIDFFEEGKDYQINYLNYCEDVFPINITFDQFIYYFERFGNNGWYYSFIDKKTLKAMYLQDYNQASFDEIFKEYRENNLFIEDLDFLRSKIKKK